MWERHRPGDKVNGVEGSQDSSYRAAGYTADYIDVVFFSPIAYCSHFLPGSFSYLCQYQFLSFSSFDYFCLEIVCINTYSCLKKGKLFHSTLIRLLLSSAVKRMA